MAERLSDERLEGICFLLEEKIAELPAKDSLSPGDPEHLIRLGLESVARLAWGNLERRRDGSEGCGMTREEQAAYIERKYQEACGRLRGKEE